MAGGFLILGQAAASASDADVSGSNNAAAGNTASYDAEAANSNESVTTGGEGGSGGSGGGAETVVDQDADARNNVSNNAESGTVNANGGDSYVIVFAGNGNSVDAGSGDKGDVNASQTVHNEVDVASQGGNASVSNSNNAAAGNGASYNADASNHNDSVTTGGDAGKHGDGGDAYTDVVQDADARNNVDNNAESGTVNANGGDSVVGVIAGNGNSVDAGSDDKGDAEGSQVIHNEVDVASRGGDAGVHGSNNAAAGNAARYNANARNDNDSVTSGGDGGKHGDGGYGDTYLDQDSDARNNVDNNAETGTVNANGGDSIIKVIVGNDNTLTCYSEEGDVDCSQHITNIINIISIGGDADVTCSNNATAGGGSAWVCKPNEKPVHHAPAQPAPAKHEAAPVQQHHKAAAPVHHRAAAPMNTHAQPKGQLAYTGAETTAPLTLGLLALGAGGALTLAGRRRTATAAV
ncbi:hypothetical protein [Blastococcus haudaquaticus]|nr:hypothetical protein [Blastococcus haudaquaticus]